MDYFWARFLVKNILDRRLDVVVEGDGLMPQFPKDLPKTVNIHGSRRLVDLPERLQYLRSRPGRGNPVIKEHIRVCHQVECLEIGEAYLDRKGGDAKLPDIHKHIM